MGKEGHCGRFLIRLQARRTSEELFQKRIHADSSAQQIVDRTDERHLDPALFGKPAKDGGGTAAVPAASSAPGVEIVDDEDDDSDLDRDPEGPEGGATTEEILAAGAAGKWLEVQRLLSISGSSDPRVTDMQIGRAHV